MADTGVGEAGAAWSRGELRSDPISPDLLSRESAAVLGDSANVPVSPALPVALQPDRHVGSRNSRRPTVRRDAARYALVGLDSLAIAVSALVGLAVASMIGDIGIPRWQAFLIVPLLVTSMLIHGMYRGNGLRLVPSGMPVFNILAHSLPIALLAVVGASFALGWTSHPADAFVLSVALLLPTLGTVPMVRSVAAHLGAKWGIGRKQRVLVVGAGEVADHVVGRLRRHGLITALGMVDDDPLPGFETIGGLRDIPHLCDTLQVDRIVVALPRAPWLEVSEVIQPLIGAVDVAIVPSHYELITWRSGTADLAGMPLIPLLGAQRSIAARAGKRAADLLVGGLSLVVATPLIAVAAIAIKLSSPGPVFFRQSRAGRSGRTFTIWKFRTMVVDAEARQTELRSLSDADGPRFKINADPRITRVGRILRRFSIDELPQLFNVLRGTMSLVGPRPFPLDQAEALYLDPAVSRFEMQPGMTGLWQVSGRSDLSWDDLCRLDSVYVGSWSLLWDLRILLQTPAAVLRRGGAY
jgi:exopolysaccharide biosynthesis polyprenyl glycosylphosphotransferase